MAKINSVLHLLLILVVISSILFQSQASYIDQGNDRSQRILHLPLHRVNRLATSANGTLHHETFDDHMLGTPGTGYVIHIWLGTPPQKLGVIVDTGSSNFAVAATPNLALKRYFEFQSSSTFVNLQRTFSVRYAKGYWDGQLASDIFRIGSASLKGSARVQFAAIFKSKNFFVPYSHWQGILGMAYPSIAMPPYRPVQPVFNQFVSETGLPDIFTLTLCGPIIKHTQHFQIHDVNVGGMMTFGGIDHSLFSPPLFYTPIIKKWYYQVQLTGLAIAGRSLGFSCQEYDQYRTIVDSGTTAFRLPNPIFNRIVLFARQMTKVTVPNGFWEGREALCWEANNAQWDGFPYLEVSLNLDDVNKTNPDQDAQFTLMIAPQQYLRLAEHVTVHNSPCYGFGISRSQGNGIILGDVVMEGFTVIFDRANSRIGFAASKCATQNYQVKPLVLGPQLRGNNSCDVTGAQNGSPVAIIIGSVGAALFVIGFFMVMVVHLKVQSGRNDMPYVDPQEYRQQMQEAKLLQPTSSSHYDGPPSRPPPPSHGCEPQGAGPYPYYQAPSDDPPEYAETQ